MKSSFLALALLAAGASAAAETKTWPAGYWSGVVPAAAASAVPVPAAAVVAPAADIDVRTGFFGAFDSVSGCFFLESQALQDLEVVLPGALLFFR